MGGRHRFEQILATLLILASCTLVFPAQFVVAADPSALDHFEKKVRPLLAAHCWKCHGSEKVKGGLRLDSAAALAKGGDSGRPVVLTKPEESLVIQAVRQTGELKMPPGGVKLKDQEIASLVAWVKAGAVFPAGTGKPAVETPRISASAPNEGTLRSALQAWYKADSLPLTDGKSVQVWPDSSGRGHDLAATTGVRRGGVGTAPRFAASSSINRRPAVHFETDNGLAGSPDHPVDIRGDAALTIFLVVNLKPHDAQPPFDGILCIGNPANPNSDPGKPMAALIQVNRLPEPELRFAGGWNHDASLGSGSFKPLYNRPVLLSFVKKPGPMKKTTRFFIDGTPSEDKPIGRAVEGRETVPDIQHRDDIGLYMGKALAWCGSIRGDISEAIVYNKALSDAERGAIEVHLAEKYGLPLPALLRQTEVKFSPEQKAFWAFQPVKNVALPVVKTPWGQSPLDQFIASQLEVAGLCPTTPADKRTLLRRVTFDLTGLPPAPQEMEAFLADNSPVAFEKAVDRLLASPHYGERWARHWLDVVRYAETTANDANAVMRYAWRYRDYVTGAFNKDKPYSDFIIDQLAGDLLPGAPAESAIATGFLMIGAKALAETDKEQSRIDVVDDQLDVTGRAFLGLTVGCARCHDHKFDPIPTLDYYSLAGIFRSTEVFRDDVRNASMWNEWPLPAAPGQKPTVIMAPKEGVPSNLRIHVRGNRHTLGFTAPRRFLQIIAGENHAPLATEQSGRLELARWIASKDNPLTARVMVNRIWQHHFGTGLVATSDNFGFRGEKPSHPELLDWLACRFVESGYSIKAMHRLMVLSSTYQMSSAPNERAMLADPGNRLLWQIPRRRLDAESLRDALLAISGKLDRAIGGDESGEFLFGAGEVIDKNRDFFRPNQVKADHPFYTNSVRRSLYLPVVRNSMPDVLTLFDAADPNGVTAVRNETTVPSQALFLMNHPFVRQQALHFAQSLLADGVKDEERIQSAFHRALGRPPSAGEMRDGLEFVEKYVAQSRTKSRVAAWQSYCQMLFCSNEFLYVE